MPKPSSSRGAHTACANRSKSDLLPPSATTAVGFPQDRRRSLLLSPVSASPNQNDIITPVKRRLRPTAFAPAPTPAALRAEFLRLCSGYLTGAHGCDIVHKSCSLVGAEQISQHDLRALCWAALVWENAAERVPRELKGSHSFF